MTDMLTNSSVQDQNDKPFQASLATSREVTHPSSFSLFDNLVLTYEDMVDRLRIPKRSLERMVASAQIPHRKVGRHVRFYWPAIVDWLQNDKGARRR